MTIQGRIEKIATDAMKGYVDATGFLRRGQNNCSNLGKIQSYDKDGNLVVMMVNGTTQTVSPGGIRPIGPDGTVFIIDGQIVG